MSTAKTPLHSPLDSIAGAGLAEALRDALAPAERAPGTPPEHKQWAHLARYLREDCGFGAEPESWVALLCSREFRAAWFREASPHLPKIRVPLFCRALWRSVTAGEGAKALAALRAAGQNNDKWKLPDAKGRWKPEHGGPEFRNDGAKDARSAPKFSAYEDWFREFGRGMWYVMDADRNADVEAWLLSTSMQERTSMFDERELEEIAAAMPNAPVLADIVTRWLLESGTSIAAADAEACRITKALSRFGPYGHYAAAWVEGTDAGRKLAARFDGRRLATVWAKSPSAPDMGTFALFDRVDADIPKLKALAATLAAREARSELEMRIFREEAGPARLAMMGERAAAVARLHGQAAVDSTKSAQPR